MWWPRRGFAATPENRPVGPRRLRAVYSATAGLALLAAIAYLIALGAAKPGLRGVLEPVVLFGFFVLLAGRTLWRVLVLWTGRHVTSRLTLGAPWTWADEQRENTADSDAGSSSSDGD